MEVRSKSGEEPGKQGEWFRVKGGGSKKVRVSKSGRSE